MNVQTRSLHLSVVAHTQWATGLYLVKHSASATFMHIYVHNMRVGVVLREGELCT